MIPRRSWLDDERGFTLAELLVVTAVLTLVMAGVFAIQQGGQQAYLLGSNRVEAQQSARIALDLMARELRTASPNGPAPSGIVSIPSTTSITFRDQCGNSVQYSLAGTQLNRTAPDYSDINNCIVSGNSTSSLIDGVVSLTMTYYSAYDVYNDTYTTTTDATKIIVIKVSIKAKGTTGDQPATMESTIKLRATLS